MNHLCPCSHNSFLPNVERECSISTFKTTSFGVMAMRFPIEHKNFLYSTKSVATLEQKHELSIFSKKDSKQ